MAKDISPAADDDLREIGIALSIETEGETTKRVVSRKKRVVEKTHV